MTDDTESNASSGAPVEDPGKRMPVELEIVRGKTIPSDALGQTSASDQALSVPADYRPCKSAEVLELDMGDGAILYDNDARLVHHLNPSATLIWQLCDGSGSAEELARDIAEEFGLDRGIVGDQVLTVIAELDALGLVVDGRGSDDDSDGLRTSS